MNDSVHNKVIRNYLFVILAVVSLVGCSTGRVVETGARISTSRVVSVEASEEAPHTIQIPSEIRTRFQLALDEELYLENHFQRGRQLKIKWQLAALDEGNRALRYFVGFGAGRGKITVRARFLDERGREVGRVQGEGTIVMGLFGGSYDAALSECAAAIAKYARRNFLTPSAR